MKIKKLPIVGCYEIILNPIKDNRGNFTRVYDEKILKKIFKRKWVQHNESLNIKNKTFRGFHAQKKPFAESKLVRAIHGEAMDMILDIRKNSKTFKKLIKIKLLADNNMIFIPRGCAHGYLTLKKNTRLSYLHDNFYSKKHEINISYKDPIITNKIKIRSKDISKKDLAALNISELKHKFVF
tara:strand:+ start:144 stop:689 length:546 start_codon:yes stop_codon:yes gene_type:complete